MKTNALIMEEPGELTEQEIDLPDRSATDVLLRVKLTGICGTDVHMYNGGMDLNFPVVPGHEFAGTIEELGEEVSTDSKREKIEEGDNLAVVPLMPGGTDDWYSRNMPTRPRLNAGADRFGFESVAEQYTGGMSEYVVLPEKAAYYKLPDDMDLELGALVEPLSVGSHAVDRAYQPGLPHMKEGFGVGQSIAVQGAGPIGLLVMCAAKAAGAGQIIAVDAIDERLSLAEEYGATDTVNLANYNGDRLIQHVKGLTNGVVGPDVVVGAAGVPQAVPQAIELPHDGGTFVEVGHFAYSGDVEINPTRIVQKELNIYGSLGYPPSQFATSIKLLDQLQDEVPFKTLFNHRATFETAEEAYAAQESGDAYRATIHPHEE